MPMGYNLVAILQLFCLQIYNKLTKQPKVWKEFLHTNRWSGRKVPVNSGKNLLKLYMNDVGILTDIFFGTNIKAVMEDITSINLGSVYETVVAQELKAHGFNLYYYDNKKAGEVDHLVDDMENLSVLPIEVKSGKDYKVHSALNKFVNTDEYNIRQAFVLSNAQKVEVRGGITYLPIYYIMCIEPDKPGDVFLG